MTQTEEVLQVRECWKTTAFQPVVGWVNLYGVSRNERGDGCNIVFYYVVPCPGFITQEYLGTATSIRIGDKFYTRYTDAPDEWERAEDEGEHPTRIVPAVIDSDTTVYNGQLEPAGNYEQDCTAPGYKQYLMSLPEEAVQQYIRDYVGKADVSDMLISEMEAYDKWTELRR